MRYGLSMRLFFALCATLLFSNGLLAGPASLDSLPTAVRNIVKTLLQDPKEAVGGVQMSQWGAGLMYEVTITMDGHPYLKADIGDTGQLLRCDPIPQTATGNKDKENGDDDNGRAIPSPSAS
jgi:hypothetical protein